MRYGIPRYRLPDVLLDEEIGDVLSLGIQFKPNQALGKDVTLAQVKEEGYRAVFLAVGAQLSMRIPLEGSDSPDVLWGVDFLAKVAEGERAQLPEKVVVIGGGNVAVDVALTARRCGAKVVTMICLETREEMSAHPWEIEGVLEEGVKLLPSWGPHKIMRDRGRITGMEIMHCVSVLDDQGVFNPKFDETRRLIEADQVILAIGQSSDLSFLQGGSPIAVKGGLVVVDEATLETGMKGVYAGGDVTAGPGAIIHAVAAGRKAASSIDKALGGPGDIEEVLFERGVPRPYVGREEAFASRQRVKVPELDLSLRQGFQEVALGYADESAIREAKRCLQCDLRLYMGCNPFPPEKIIEFKEENIRLVPEAEGVFQLYDEDRNMLAIKGAANLRAEILLALKDYDKGAWFDFEEDQMYSKRESELIQKYLQDHGKMPGGATDDEDLF